MLVTCDNKHNPFACESFRGNPRSDVQQKTEDGLTYTALSFMLQLHSGSKNGMKISIWLTCIVGDYIQTTILLYGLIRPNRQEIPIF